ncbi:MAG: L,D-transpeptidase [Gammaproteobacteria bacterium]|nr:L,D-transpeptidase [Gammaproteobacteria bacterium]
MKRIAPFLLAQFGLLAYAAAACAASPQSIQIEVSKSGQIMLVKQDGQVIRRFHVALGKGGNGTKQRLGDNKTPLGRYRIVDFRGDSRFHYFMQLDYPNLLDAWHGYRNELIDASQFKAIATTYGRHELPPQDTALGGYIGIHGIGESSDERLRIHRDNNWTEGCIALTNEDLNELRAFVAIGTRVVITE